MTSNMDVLGVLPTQAVWTRRVSFHNKQYGLARCTPFNLHTVFVNAGMPDRPASDQCGTRMKKNTDARTSLVPELGIQNVIGTSLRSRMPE
jgi:hypothetical protein